MSTRTREVVVRIDPHAERVLLAAALADASARERILARLTPAHWIEPRHRAAWTAIADAHVRGIDPWDPAILGSVSSAVDVAYLGDLVDSRPEVPEDLDALIDLQVEMAARASLTRGPLSAYLDAIGSGRPLAELHALAGELARAHEPGLSSRASIIGEPVPADWYAEPPPRRSWLLRDRRTAYTSHDGDGVLPLGRVGLLVAAGGAGKTMALIQLATAIATATPWLGVWAPDEPGRVLLLLGEEERDEARRRVYRAARVAGVEPPDDTIHVAALAGRECALLARGATGDPVVTPYYARLLAHVRETGPWALVALDPLARFAGAEAETANAWGTRYIALLESIAEASGATALCAHHSSQWARRAGPAGGDAIASRGVTGLTDGARWVATLTVERPKAKEDAEDGPPGPADVLPDEVITLALAKSNYSRRCEPILLGRDDEQGGALVPLDGVALDLIAVARAASTPTAARHAEREALDATRRTAEDEAVLAAVRERPGISLRDLRQRVAAVAHCGTGRAEVAIARLAPILDVREGPRGARLHYLPPSGPASVTGPTPPSTPPVRGRTDRVRPGPALGSDGARQGQSQTDDPLPKEELNGIAPPPMRKRSEVSRPRVIS